MRMLQTEATGDRGSVNVLVVDDEQLIRELLSEGLRNAGYGVVEARNVDQALRELEHSNPELVLADIQMPGRNGIDLLEKIVNGFPDTAVVMVSGVNEIDTALSAVKTGAYDYITKPFSLDVVVSSVERALEKRRLILENRNYQFNLERLVEQRTMELKKTLGRIQSTYDATIKALGAALDLRDSDTEDHSMRVAEYVTKLAKAIGVSDRKQLKDIEWGAFLHDIGKIGIPDAILRKPGKLSEEEMAVIKLHPELGYRVLKRIPFLRGAAELVNSHHEWYDGSGYPRGLKGEQIPLCARLFTVADTIDAMTSDRPYRKALSIDKVGEELRKLAWIQFDPQIVTVFSSIPLEKWGIGSSE